MFVSQPSISAGIKKLEKELGVALFERTGRGVILTSAGELFLKKAQGIVEQYKSIKEEIQKFKDVKVLKLGVLYSVRSSGLAQLIGDFHKEHPSVIIEIFNGYLEDLQDWLDKGEIDIAITWLDDDDDQSFSTPLFYQALKLAVPENHVYAKQKSVSLKDLDGQPYIKRVTCEFLQTYPEIFDSAGVKPKFIYFANNEEWVISLIQSGIGMSIMPVWKNITNIIYVPIIDLNLTRAIGLKGRKTLSSETVELFKIFTQNHNWSL